MQPPLKAQQLYSWFVKVIIPFIFLADSMAYAENRQNGGLTRFSPKGDEGTVLREKGRGLGAAPLLFYRSVQSLLARQGSLCSDCRVHDGHARLGRCCGAGCTLRLECPHRDLIAVNLDKEHG